MSLLSVIRAFKTGDYVARRRGTGTFTDGKYTQGAYVEIPFKASVQPLSGRELKALPEAQEGDEVKVLWTETQLFTRTSTNDPDIVIEGGEEWEVFKVEPFKILSNHYRVHIVRRSDP